MGGLTDDPNKCMVISGGQVKEADAYRSSHEEADDKIMFSVNQLYTKKERLERSVFISTKERADNGTT